MVRKGTLGSLWQDPTGGSQGAWGWGHVSAVKNYSTSEKQHPLCCWALGGTEQRQRPGSAKLSCIPTSHQGLRVIGPVWQQLIVKCRTLSLWGQVQEGQEGPSEQPEQWPGPCVTCRCGARAPPSADRWPLRLAPGRRIAQLGPRPAPRCSGVDVEDHHREDLPNGQNSSRAVTLLKEKWPRVRIYINSKTVKYA